MLRVVVDDIQENFFSPGVKNGFPFSPRVTKSIAAALYNFSLFFREEEGGPIFDRENLLLPLCSFSPVRKCGRRRHRGPFLATKIVENSSRGLSVLLLHLYRVGQKFTPHTIQQRINNPNGLFPPNYTLVQLTSEK